MMILFCFSKFLYLDFFFFFLFFVFDFKNVSNFDWSFMSLKSILSANSWSAFVIFLRLWSFGFKYLIKNHFKHSWSSIFRILINRFLAWPNPLQIKLYTLNFIKLILTKGLYFEMVEVWSITQVFVCLL